MNLDNILNKRIEIISEEFAYKYLVHINEINDVLNGKLLSSYGCIYSPQSLSQYYLYYITSKYNKIEGKLLRLDSTLKSRCDLTFKFAQVIYEDYAEDKVINLFYLFERYQYIVFKRLDVLTSVKHSFPENLWEYSVSENLINGKDNFVYLMKNLRNGLFKIGRSLNPDKRERTLQSEEPEIKLFLSRKAPKSAELALHERYKKKRVRGEWFYLCNNDVKNIEKFLLSKNN
ncbi:GIY-YIG nuclease family protein [Cytophagaceae bacterium ABcell3]|nr:GIY-YIG nuclease family protein [Cytophagaceae bacterium ABcell3]